ncbi:MAG: TRAP transporter large permease subunit [Pseudomonadota bacterium]
MELLFLAILILVMAAALASGFPVAFALPGAAIITIALAAGAGLIFAGNSSAFFASGGPIEWLTAGVTNFRGVYWEVERDTLIAIPLFVFMGIMLQRSKIAEDLLVTMARLFGPVPGGLGISVVFVGALLAATTGILGATVVAMGLISLPAMLRNNYSQSLATGTIAASGTLGQIIPPSIVLIILADQLASAVDQADTARKALYKDATGNLTMPSEFGVVSTSAGDMFLGALVPGLVLVGLYMAYILALALLRPHIAPSVPFEGKADARFWSRVVLILVPPLTLIFVVLGSIITGVATVNQAGAIGAVGAMIMAGYRLREGEPNAFIPAGLALISLIAIFVILANFDVNVRNIKTADDQLGVTLASIAVALFLIALVWSGWRTYVIDDTLRQVAIDTAKTTSLVFIILLGAAMLTAAFRAFGGEELVKEFLTNLPGGFWAQFVIVMAVIFLLGFFLDFIEIAVVVVPIVAPILLMDPSANITAVWLGVMIGLNIQTSFLTPPFGFALFYLRGVAPQTVTTLNMYKGVVPFISLQLLALAIVGLTPPLVNYLPTRLSLLSETAPPPSNPRLQLCLEEYNFTQLLAQRGDITAAITNAGQLDVSSLPRALQRDLTTGFTRAGQVYDRIDAVEKSVAAVTAATPAYRPLHQTVRSLQQAVRRDQVEIRKLETELRLSAGQSDAERNRITARIEALKVEISELESQIPEDWKSRHDAFVKLQRAELNARRQYRRTADGAYTPILKVIEVLDGVAALEAVRPEIESALTAVDTKTPAEVTEILSPLVTTIGRIDGARAVRTAVSRARRAARRRTPNMEEARTKLQEALTKLDEDLAWRKPAAASLREPLANYAKAIESTVGLRQQRRMHRDAALSVAACQSGHRDISLSF